MVKHGETQLKKEKRKKKKKKEMKRNETKRNKTKQNGTERDINKSEFRFAAGSKFPRFPRQGFWELHAHLLVPNIPYIHI